MGIFTKKQLTMENGREFLGGYIPPTLNEYIAKYSLATGVSKSVLFTNVLENWKEEHSSEMSDKELNEKIAEKALIAFKNTKQKRPKFNITEFVKDLRFELTKKGISSNDTNAIAKIIENETNKTT